MVKRYSDQEAPVNVISIPIRPVFSLKVLSNMRPGLANFCKQVVIILKERYDQHLLLSLTLPVSALFLQFNKKAVFCNEL
jgi:hypothetical protein